MLQVVFKSLWRQIQPADGVEECEQDSDRADKAAAMPLFLFRPAARVFRRSFGGFILANGEPEVVEIRAEHEISAVNESQQSGFTEEQFAAGVDQFG